MWKYYLKNRYRKEEKRFVCMSVNLKKNTPNFLIFCKEELINNANIIRFDLY